MIEKKMFEKFTGIKLKEYEEVIYYNNDEGEHCYRIYNTTTDTLVDEGAF